MGVAPCVPYVAILTYIACIAENDIFSRFVVCQRFFALGTAIAPISIRDFHGFLAWPSIEVDEIAQNFSGSMWSNAYSFRISAFILCSLCAYVRLKGF